MKSNILKIIIIDNDPILLEIYRCYFETYLGYSLGGLYLSVKDALLDYDNVKPDTIFSEIALSEISGIEGIRFFRKKDRTVKIVILSDQSDFHVIKKTFENRANGYLTKPIAKKHFHNALDSLKHEGSTMSNDIVSKFISKFHRKLYQFISERENQIIDYLRRGATYKTIANILFGTTSAINFHIQNIYKTKCQSEIGGTFKIDGILINV